MYKKILISILIAGALVRLWGIGFGLPLWLVGDEPSLIFGALKMLEVRTLLPALHPADFTNILYYTPYLPYWYLPAFIGSIGFKWLMFSGDFSQFALVLKSNVSGFFLLARLYSAIFGTLTIWLVYKSALHIFKKQTTALAAAFLMAFAFLPVSYSHWARHWTPVTMFFALTIYYLSRPDWSTAKRYLAVAVVAGIGIGVNLQVVFALVFALLWAILVDKLSILKTIKQLWFWQALGIFSLGSVIAYIIWPKGFDFLQAFSRPVSAAAMPKTVSGFFYSYWFYVEDFFKAEPFFLFLILIGSTALFRRARNIFITVWGFTIFYIAIFFAVFSVMDRFILVLYPFFSIIGGYGLIFAYEYLAGRNAKIGYIFLGLMGTAMVAPIIKFDYLLQKNDTRNQVTKWAEANIGESKIAVLVPLMRLPANPEAIQALENIDEQALRTIDKAEKSLTTGKRFNVLNLYTVVKPDFFKALPTYLNNNNFKYLIVDKTYAKSLGVDLDQIEIGQGSLEFKGSVSSLNHNVSSGHQQIPDGFGDGWREIFLSPSFGPDIWVIKLN